MFSIWSRQEITKKQDLSFGRFYLSHFGFEYLFTDSVQFFLFCFLVIRPILYFYSCFNSTNYFLKFIRIPMKHSVYCLYRTVESGLICWSDKIADSIMNDSQYSRVMQWLKSQASTIDEQSKNIVSNSIEK